MWGVGGVVVGCVGCGGGCCGVCVVWGEGGGEEGVVLWVVFMVEKGGGGMQTLMYRWGGSVVVVVVFGGGGGVWSMGRVVCIVQGVYEKPHLKNKNKKNTFIYVETRTHPPIYIQHPPTQSYTGMVCDSLSLFAGVWFK